MKKLLFIVVAVIAISCGEGSKNQSVNSDQEVEENAGEIATPADSTGMIPSDSTSFEAPADSVQ